MYMSPIAILTKGEVSRVSLCSGLRYVTAWLCHYWKVFLEEAEGENLTLLRGLLCVNPFVLINVHHDFNRPERRSFNQTIVRVLETIWLHFVPQRSTLNSAHQRGDRRQSKSLPNWYAQRAVKSKREGRAGDDVMHGLPGAHMWAKWVPKPCCLGGSSLDNVGGYQTHAPYSLPNTQTTSKWRLVPYQLREPRLGKLPKGPNSPYHARVHNTGMRVRWLHHGCHLGGALG